MIMGHDPKFSAITGKVARMYSKKYRSFATRQLATSFIVDEELVKFIAAARLVLNISVTARFFLALLMRRQCSLLKSLSYFNKILSAKLYMQMVKTPLIFKA